MRPILLALVTLAACTQTQLTAPSPQLPPHIRDDLAQHEATLREPSVVAAGIGEIADLGDGLRVRPMEVLEDSRCPQNARCMWAGRLRVRVSVEGVGNFEVALDEPATATPRGSFALVAASPGPWTDWPEGSRPPYRFGFRRA